MCFLTLVLTNTPKWLIHMGKSVRAPLVSFRSPAVWLAETLPAVIGHSSAEAAALPLRLPPGTQMWPVIL